ncbi:hypothetical protein ACVJGD_004430 [Bradyrhizobium sp. USDA 10063]
MNHTLREANVQRYYCEDHQQLREFLDAYNVARRLKTLQGLTSYEAICKA